MKIRVVDFETTGMVGKDEPVGIVEAGWTDVLLGGSMPHITRPSFLMVNPGIPVMPEARAAHHLTDDEIAGGVSPEDAHAFLYTGMELGDVFAAHHAKFDRALFSGDPFPWICTMVCAKHLWPDMPSYGNQALRYRLGIDKGFVWPELAMPPHRAGPDTYVTAHILGRMLSTTPAARLVELTTTPVLLKTVPFGKYEGQLWSDMDRGYLEWVVDPKREFKQEVVDTANHWLRRLSQYRDPFA
ncbi:exodeoxyribonuclease X [Ancylobacter sp. 3268]|uniref:hypothetical protein n=1 Tax=Ancylobacter sp. 3268 TaxID=2817752 RepID=UPI00286642A4|nr:hypothetical protein [Ancylobacter sp. 3268]MDR6954188.1 exodeoxyribonuclease X [Ancylobacter sp. 3268]